MGKHIPPFDNQNQPVIDVNDDTTPLCYFNPVSLKQGESHTYRLENYESVVVLAGGTCDITVNGESFPEIGQRESVWDGDPSGVYVPVGSEAVITCVSNAADVLIAGGRYDDKDKPELQPFAVTPNEVDKVQYGSDDTKTHRKIKHILGQKNADQRGRLLVSELFTVGAGGWSGFPSHKHDEERPPTETRYEEVYQFRFNPGQGFGAQFLYEHEDDQGPVYHVKTGSVIAIDKGYHPSVAAPGYEMYYFTIIVGESSKSLIQYFDPHHEYQVHTIPGIKDMVAKFK
ncbi:Putative myo-inositol catabolism protein [Vibrio nigripulchritudo MADA3029]|uniref:5-deoxy-glucuronate isomerase n=1 Tax=Vibrio nigripulchritudo TaxID=28173 RepID=UPI0003B1D077|nr:5-deoxy-glucuronate isomerase [Vibrio nigripulchritudo]CCN50375.1 Putative myo-inositol catabolism protein [Vibrio nigripulchritudo MADA3020]CCN52326.1 Putative myo-inositol catabolism protein [Vibrio nigripulchritudo MADA3021]CCN62152.1 Putative myo-inositol catabolism protein [Vibrio nigripulchritudo MADA3029]